MSAAIHFSVVSRGGEASRPERGAGSLGESLGRAEEALLIRRARAGDGAARERLVEANVRLVYRIARRYRCRSHSLEDLVQEGIVGLLLAIERWDESRGCRLSTYAVHWIRQAVTRAAEQNDRLIHVPMQASAELRRLMRLREIRGACLGRPPTEAELARDSGIPEPRVKHLLGMVEDAVSLESLVGADEETCLLELAVDPAAPNPEHGALTGLRSQQLRRLVCSLRPRERWIVVRRFGLDGESPQTLDELSRRMRISRERVRQIEARAMQKLRCLMCESQWD